MINPLTYRSQEGWVTRLRRCQAGPLHCGPIFELRCLGYPDIISVYFYGCFDTCETCDLFFVDFPTFPTLPGGLAWKSLLSGCHGCSRASSIPRHFHLSGSRKLPSPFAIFTVLDQLSSIHSSCFAQVFLFFHLKRSFVIFFLFAGSLSWTLFCVF